MVGNLRKIGICALTFAVIGVLEQRPLWALTTASTSATLLTEIYPDVGSYQAANTHSIGEVTDKSNLETNELILLAKRNTEEISQASQVTQVTVDDTTRYYITQEPTATQENYTPSYRNIFAKVTNAPRKRKVPEPSALLGLIAMIGYFGTQGRNWGTDKSKNI
ncbi:hypothetical protein JMG10_41130 [Nostoc ellipsosporum NOK]|nr:hypothetical protein [Nostoc ellipsosporum NOK]